MRFNITIEHSQRMQAHRAAYAEQDKLATAGDDHSTEAAAANDAEYAALDAIIASRSITPVEMAEKIAFFRQRGPLAEHELCWNEEDMRLILDGFERDLRAFAGPSVSPAMTEAFNAWRATWLADCFDNIGDDDHDSALSTAMAAKAKDLFDVPCFLPGDFMVKAYIELLLQLGPEGHGCRVDNAFMPKEADIGNDGYLEQHAQRAMINDLQNCDLGRLLFTFGRVAFDPVQWLEAATELGTKVHVMLDSQGKRSMSVSLEGTPAQRNLQAIIAFQGEDRHRQLADLIVADHPELVVRIPDDIGAAIEQGATADFGNLPNRSTVAAA